MPIINVPYRYDARSARQLAKYPSLKWTDPKYNSIKKKIKKHYCIQQKKRCAYCNNELASKCSSEHIEHIVDKDNRPEWQLEPYNLCLSCTHCNTKKGTKKSLHDFARKAVTVPLGKAFYRIIHAHFDNWDDHLYYEDSYFIKPSSDKGVKTIEVCGLHRHLYIDQKMKLDYNNYSDRILLLSLKREEDMSDAERQAIDDYIEELTQYL